MCRLLVEGPQALLDVGQRQAGTLHPVQMAAQVLQRNPCRGGGLKKRLTLALPLLPEAAPAVEAAHELGAQFPDSVSVADVPQ